MEPLLNIAVKAALRAGDIMLRYRNQLDNVTVTEKSKNDFVSEVDIRIEQAIIENIQRAHPDHSILAEESGSIDGTEDVQWIIDPIDGTTNYLRGLPHFAVSIGIKIKNRIEYGVIYDPSLQELFTAKRGSGARLNDRRIRVGKVIDLSQALLGTGFSRRQTEFTHQHMASIQALLGKCGGFRRAGSAALDLAYVAAGRLDGLWEFGLKPWDLAAGSLLIREAGGLITDFEGGENFAETGNVIAANPKLFKELLRTLHSSISENASQA